MSAVGCGWGGDPHSVKRGSDQTGPVRSDDVDKGITEEDEEEGEES